MRGHEALIAFTIAFLLIGTKEYRAQSDESDDSAECPATSVESQDLEPTYTSHTENLLKGLLKVVSRASPKNNGGITGFINSHLPNPIQNIVDPIENITARGFGDVLNLFEKNFHAIFPGTLWCGAGNISKSEKDLGRFNETDACCRAHDNCSSNIDAGDTKGPLLNSGIFTRSACSCDTEFYNCLKNVDSVISNNIGSTYFNILAPQCFGCNYPIESCDKYESKGLGRKKCVKYNFDTSKGKELEWFDNPNY